jgi:enoyl-CoA hydratase
MLAQVKDGIGWVTFNSPERRNAISLEMWEGLATIMEAFQHGDQVRVVVMTGAGDKSFVSGTDILEFDSKRGSAAQKESYGKIAASANRWLVKLDKSLIAMIQGFCIGGGPSTALSADIRFATPDSTFGIPAAKLGLGYEYEGLKRLTELVGSSRAKDIMFSARFMAADEAFQMGLVNRVCEIEDAVRDYAALITANAPLTVKAAKAAINEAVKDSERRDLESISPMTKHVLTVKTTRKGGWRLKKNENLHSKGTSFTTFSIALR